MRDLRERHNLYHKERTSRIRKGIEENGSLQIAENLHIGKDDVVRPVALHTFNNRTERSILLLKPLELHCYTTNYKEISQLNLKMEEFKPKWTAVTVPRMTTQDIQKENKEGM